MVDVCLPAVSGTLCLVPRNRSENKQEAVFLPGGIRDDFMGEEIFKEREKHGEKSPGRMIKHSQKSGRPPPPQPSPGPHLSISGIPRAVGPGT